MNKDSETSNSPQVVKFLGRKGEKILKAIHLFFVALTIGSIFSILVLFTLKHSSRADDFLLNWSMFHIFDRIVYYSFLGNFLTGLTYSLFTRWGFFKIHWVTLKWIGFFLLFLFLAFGLEPALSGLAALSDSGLFLTESNNDYSALGNRGLLSVIALAIILILLLFVSTMKPWKGRKKDLIVNLKMARIILLSFIAISGIGGGYSIFTLSALRAMPIEKVDLMEYADDVYEGVFAGGGGPYIVQVTIKNKVITDIQLSCRRQSKYLRYAEGVIPRIIELQSPAVDAISGATTTSKCIMKAVENAMNPSSKLKN